jgi:hypothetical protein
MLPIHFNADNPQRQHCRLLDRAIGKEAADDFRRRKHEEDQAATRRLELRVLAYERSCGAEGTGHGKT